MKKKIDESNLQIKKIKPYKTLKRERAGMNYEFVHLNFIASFVALLNFL